MTRKGFLKLKLKNKNDEKTYAIGLLANRLAAFSSTFAKYFKSSTKSIHSVADQFLQGLILSPISNCQAIAKVVEASNNQSLNHFLSDSVWNWQIVMDALSKRCFKLFSLQKNPVALLIDESSFPKKGKNSVGVGHQYCGQTGKQDNCQIGVFGALCSGHFVSIIQSKLYLPKDWINNPKKCFKAGVPETEVKYKSKIDLAREIIFHVWKTLKLKFSYVSFDAFYGRDLNLLECLDKNGIVFMADIPESHIVYLKDFYLRIPKKKAGRGRTPIHARPSIKGIKLKEYVRSLKSNEFRSITIRKGTDGNIKASFHKKIVWLLNEETSKKIRFTLLIRKDFDGKIRYSLTNSSKNIKCIATMQGQRYFVERAFQDAKQQTGMNQYQVRGYAGWNRHITMSILAMQFITEEKLRQKDVELYFTSADIFEILILLLPKRNLTLSELENQIKKKNKKPQRLVRSSKCR